MTSIQTLSQPDRRRVAGWAADCAEHVLPLFEADRPDDLRPREAIARTRAFARGELDIAGEIRARFRNGGAARDAGTPAAVCHMGAHALGAAAYAARAAALARPNDPDAADQEIAWQVSKMSVDILDALRSLPPVGDDRSGPLGPGLLSSGEIGGIVRKLQAALGPGPR